MAEIVQCATDVFLDLGFQLINSAELTLIADAVEKANAKHIAVEFLVEIENICFDRRLHVLLKRRPNADVRYAPPPCAADQRRGGVNAELRDHAVVGLQVRSRETYRVTATVPANTWTDVSMPWPDVADFRTRARSLQHVAAFRTTGRAMLAGGSPQRVSGIEAEWTIFDVLGSRPAAGRSFSAVEDQPGAEHVVVLVQERAQREFGSSASAVGQRVMLNEIPHTVVGVMPPDFSFPWNAAVEFVVPLRANASTEDSGTPPVPPSPPLPPLPPAPPVPVASLPPPYAEVKTATATNIEPSHRERAMGIRRSINRATPDVRRFAGVCLQSLRQPEKLGNFRALPRRETTAGTRGHALSTREACATTLKRKSGGDHHGTWLAESGP